VCPACPTSRYGWTAREVAAFVVFLGTVSLSLCVCGVCVCVCEFVSFFCFCWVFFGGGGPSCRVSFTHCTVRADSHVYARAFVRFRDPATTVHASIGQRFARSFFRATTSSRVRRSAKQRCAPATNSTCRCQRRNARSTMRPRKRNMSNSCPLLSDTLHSSDSQRPSRHLEHVAVESHWASGATRSHGR
jgi:hypothetical protein